MKKLSREKTTGVLIGALIIMVGFAIMYFVPFEKFRCERLVILFGIFFIIYVIAQKEETREATTSRVINLRCNKCGRSAPKDIFIPGRFIAGYAGFGRCTKCGKIWCMNCDAKTGTDYVYHKCPLCRVTLSNDLFG